MSKVVTARDACKIGENAREDAKETTFMQIMRRISDEARNTNELVLSDYVISGTQVRLCSYVEFLQANPEQVDRLVNMGYAIEQDVDDEHAIEWEESESYTVPYLYFWSKQKFKTVKKDGVVTIRKFTITWECEECDDERDEETV